jgi:hypothetical protein
MAWEIYFELPVKLEKLDKKETKKRTILMAENGFFDLENNRYTMECLEHKNWVFDTIILYANKMMVQRHDKEAVPLSHLPLKKLQYIYEVGANIEFVYELVEHSESIVHDYYFKVETDEPIDIYISRYAKLVRDFIARLL